jgi:hypothetical protein
MSEKSISIPNELYTELERIGIITAHLAGQPAPFPAEKVLVMVIEQYVAKMDTMKKRENTFYLPVSLSLCTGEGELVCKFDEYVKKNRIRMKSLQQSSKVPLSTLYAIASGRVPTLDSLLRLLPGLDYPSLDELLERAP